MKQPGTKILYRSSRRIGAVAEGHRIDLAPHAATVVSSPNLGALPTVSRRGSARPLTRVEQLRLVEKGLSDQIERSFSTPSERAFAAARTSLSFAHLPEDPGEVTRAVMFTEVQPDAEAPVAVCLFGSMDNFSEFLRDAEAPLDDGWSASSLPSVIEYVAGRCLELPSGFRTRYGIAIEAFKIAATGGIKGSPQSPMDQLPWHRAFVFGDVSDAAEWLAEIYIDVDLVAETGCTYNGYRRILIGAPLWITTPYLRSVRLYEDHGQAELDASEPHIRGLRGWVRRRQSGRVAGFKEVGRR
jgi:hypothetical protein